MKKNIIFDLGNVILKDKPSIVLNSIELNDKQREIIKEKFFENWNEIDLGNITLEKHWKNAKIPFELDGEIKGKIIEYYKYREFNEDVINLMKCLKYNNYNIYILSNNNKEAYEYLRNLQKFNFIDGWIVSCDYHINKPDKRLYEILFETYNINPKESFFIDDEKANIEAGISLGMNGHILNYEKYGTSQLIQVLKEENINYIKTY